MNFISSRARIFTKSHFTGSSFEVIGFTKAMFQGLAPDGGLYIPDSMPYLETFFKEMEPNLSFTELSARLAEALLSPEINAESIRQTCTESFNFSPVLRAVGPKISVLELFHGSTCAFKDFGASFMASMMNRILTEDNGKTIILTATSGDTGSAVAAAFHGKPNIDVVILYPSGRVSPLQEKQITTYGGNVTALEVLGDFDDCQRMAKAAFLDKKLRHLPLSSANSINIARLIPQSFYFVWCWYQMRESNPFTFVVPSGNFGNITAGLYARHWGLPVHHFIASTNSNTVMHRYLKTGRYRPEKTINTYSNAMDVGSPSNYERLASLYKHDVEIFRANMSSESVDDKTTLDTIKRVHNNYDYLCCPHTAVGWKAAEIYQKGAPNVSCVVLGTAAPGKFVEVVEKAIGEKPRLPEALSSLMNKQTLSIPVKKKNRDLRKWLIKRYGAN